MNGIVRKGTQGVKIELKADDFKQLTKTVKSVVCVSFVLLSRRHLQFIY